MHKQTTFIYILLQAALIFQIQTYAGIDCTMQMTKHFADMPSSQLEKFLHTYLTFKIVNSPENSHLSISDMEFLSLLLKTLNELRVKDERKALRYLHTRQGR